MRNEMRKRGRGEAKWLAEREEGERWPTGERRRMRRKVVIRRRRSPSFPSFPLGGLVCVLLSSFSFSPLRPRRPPAHLSSPSRETTADSPVSGIAGYTPRKAI